MAGGLFGRRQVEFAIEQALGPAFPIIGVGGILSGADALSKIEAGAQVVQLYTGWIYEGPELVPAILEGLSQQLDRHGFRSLGEAVGSGAPWR
mgnify:CR=1 FL=1